MYGYVYLVKNLVNGKMYVGQHSKSDNSLNSLDKNYWGSGNKFVNALKKYGYDNFERSILCWCDTQEDLDNKEIYYIKYYNTLDDSIGYNIAEGGRHNGNLIAGYSEEQKQQWRSKISEHTKLAMRRPDVQARIKASCVRRSSNLEWRKKISDAAKKQPHPPMSQETKEILHKVNLGNKYGVGNKSRTGMKDSDETRHKKSEGAKKVIHTAEWNAKISASLKGRPKSEAHKAALRHPRIKYYWKLPDGSIKIMDSNNGVRHKGWIKLNRVDDI